MSQGKEENENNKAKQKIKTKVNINQLKILGHNLGAKIVSLNFLPILHVNKTWKLHTR